MADLVSISNASVQQFNDSAIQPIVTFLFQDVIVDVVLALIVLLVGIGVGVLSGKLITKTLYEISINKLINKTTNIKTKFDELIGTIVSWIIYLITISITLRILQVFDFAINTVSIFLILLILVLLLIGLKDTISNLLGGLLITIRYQLKAGNEIQTQTVSGRIERVGLLETTIQTSKNHTYFIPNAYFAKFPVKIVHKYEQKNHEKQH